MTKRSRPLITRLRAARILVREWRQALAPDAGKTATAGEIREQKRFDEAYAALTDAIKATKP